MAQIQNMKRLIRKLQARRFQAHRDDGAAVVVGYQTNYALFVHENMEAHHRVGQAKFLEEPARTKQREIVRVVKQALRRGLSMLQSLFLGGLRLQRESQLLVPVDTGTLKNSAFTKKEGRDD